MVWESWQVIDQAIEILEAALIYSLNPTTWVTVILLSIWARQFWIPAVSGVVMQVASLVPLAIYLDKIDESSLYDLLGGDSVADTVFIFSVPVLSGMISAGKNRNRLSRFRSNPYLLIYLIVGILRVENRCWRR
jgi:hypothetical protein